MLHSGTLVWLSLFTVNIYVVPVHCAHTTLCTLVSLLRPGRGAEYGDQPVCVSVCLSVCLSASISLEPLDRSAQNFVCRSPVAMARSSYGGLMVRYVLPVLWMMSCLAIMGATPTGGWRHSNGDQWCGDTGVESDVYECVVSICYLLIGY